MRTLFSTSILVSTLDWFVKFFFLLLFRSLWIHSMHTHILASFAKLLCLNNGIWYVRFDWWWACLDTWDFCQWPIKMNDEYWHGFIKWCRVIFWVIFRPLMKMRSRPTCNYVRGTVISLYRLPILLFVVLFWGVVAGVPPIR